VHTNKVRNLFGLAGAILLFGALASTAAAKNNLNCTVVDETGKPIAKGEIVLTAVNGGKETKRKTNDRGQVEFKGLDDGAYQVGGNVDGYVFSPSAPMNLSGNVTQPCSHTLVSTNHANTILQEVLQLTQQKKLAEAEEKGKKVVELMPEESGSHYVLAFALASAGKEPEAVAAITKAAELSPEKYKDKVKDVQMMAIGTQADQLMAKGDLDAAIKKYESMLAVNNTGEIASYAYFNMAVAYGRANKLNEALTSIDKAIALKPGDAQMQQTKARLEEMFNKSLDTELKLQ
jgi:outer membrane protein assembly factor BamD (BamD/ComL family)